MHEKKAKLFVFAAPSGAGKTTLVHAVVTKRPELRFSISYTTRKPRKNEADGVDYLFVTEDEFMRLRDQGEMLEYAKVFDNYYATSRSQVEKQLAEAKWKIELLNLKMALKDVLMELKLSETGGDRSKKK